MRTRRLRMVAAVGALAFLLAACGISEDSSPRDIPVADQKELSINSERNAGAATGTARIYLLAPEATGKLAMLEPVARDVRESPTPVLESLMAGANTSERARQYRTAIPTGTRLLSARLQAGVLRVDVSKDLLQVSGSDLVDALAQVVFTSSELDGVHAVQILVEGAEQQWPAGDGALQNAPLTVYDYPGLVASAQPAYPAVPTPSQPSP